MREYSYFLRTFGSAVLEDASGRSIALPPKPLALLVVLRLHAPESRRGLERFLWQGGRGDTSNAMSQALGTLRRHFPAARQGCLRLAWSGKAGL
jgi:DNA-binding winged helix-turn-helix (wHTH) protein